MKRFLFTTIASLCLIGGHAQNITFADANVKSICVDNWDTNGDGELNEAEAAAVTNLGNVFREEHIRTFDELQYFTGLTSIGNNAFKSCYSLTSITIPNSVTSIGESAFEFCRGLTSITIPSSVTSIGESAFYDCSSLTSVDIPSSMTSIGKYVFAGCALTSVTIPSSVTSIGEYAFSTCAALTSVNIPSSVTSIGAAAFLWCRSLTSVTIPNSVTSIGSSAFHSCSGLTSITIPSSVTSIGERAFQDCSSLTSVTMESEVPPLLGSKAFIDTEDIMNCVLIVPSEEAVSNYSSWKSYFKGGIIFIHQTITYFPQSSYTITYGSTFSAPEATVKYANTIVTSPAVTYSSSNTAVATVNSATGAVTIKGTGLTIITANYAGNSTYQGSSASYILTVYDNNQSPSISFYSPTETVQGQGQSITLTPNISDPSIHASDLTWFSSDESIATVSNGVVTGVNYGTTTIICKYQNQIASCIVTVYMEGLIYVGNIFYGISEDFTYAYVTNCAGGEPADEERVREEYRGTVNIPASITHDGVSYPVKAVGPYAFYRMKDLQAVVVPSSVLEFGYRSFEKSVNLARAAFLSPSGGLLSVGERAFYECTKLNNVSLPNTTQRIDRNSFRGCTSLTTISFGNSLNYINEFALADCPVLNNVTLPQSLKSIQNGAFLNDTGLTAITYPQALEGIGSSAFANCTALKNVTFNTSVYTLTVGIDAFKGSNAISRVMVKNLDAWVSTNFSNPTANPASISKHLYDASGTEIINAVVPEGALYVNNNVFYNCSSLQSITLPATIQFVNDNIIYGCSALRKMTVKAKAVPTFIGTLDPSTMNGVFQATTLYVPEASLNAYKNDSYWKRFKQILKDESGDVPDFIPGDANGDNKVNGTDIVVIANMVLGRKEKNAAADANQDGKVNGTDIVVVANIVLGRSSAPVRKAPAVTASGSATLSIEPFSITAGSEATMTIDLNNPDDVLTLVQFDLTLPKGLSIKTVGGDYDIDMAGRTSWRKHSLDANLNDGYYTFLLKSDSNTPIDGTSGGIITVTLVADASFAGGKIVIDNTVLTTPNEVEINPARYEYSLGGNEPTPVPEGTCLFIEPFSITAGSEATMTIDLNNADDVITLVQFDLTLPKGLSIKTVGGDYDIDMAGRTSWRKHSLDANLNDGYYTFLLKSDSNTPIDGTSGGIITVTLVADATFDGGKIVIDNTVLTTPEEVEINPVRYEYSLEGATAIEGAEIVKTDDGFIYDLSGRRVTDAKRPGIYIRNGKKFYVK